MTIGVMNTLSREGDTKISWDSDNVDEVEAARATFNKLTGKGYLAYRTVGRDDTRGEHIRAFDPTAEKIVLVPALQGG